MHDYSEALKVLIRVKNTRYKLDTILQKSKDSNFSKKTLDNIIVKLLSFANKDEMYEYCDNMSKSDKSILYRHLTDAKDHILIWS